MTPSEEIAEKAQAKARLELGSEYGYMGQENASHYVAAILDWLDENWHKK